MLDYDAMRSKAKKLTEKPDKDPTKLPRTEKETEMVSPDTLPYSNHIFSAQDSTPCDVNPEPDLTVPSPPKALERPEIQKLRVGRRASVRVRALSPMDVLERTTSRFAALKKAEDSTSLQRSSSIDSTSNSTTLDGNRDFQLASDHNAPTAIRGWSRFRKNLSRTTSNPTAVDPQPSFIIPHQTQTDPKPLPLPTGTRTSTAQPGSISSTGRMPLSTPFFQPSELEEIMEPFKLEFIRKNADQLEQAKAAYEQLNEQLTTELPQLIDLR